MRSRIRWWFSGRICGTPTYRLRRWLRWRYETLLHPGRYSVDWSPDVGLMAPMLDGKPIQDCVTLDECEGWVEVFARDTAGQLVIERHGDEARLVFKRLYGRAKMAWRDPANLDGILP